MYFEILRRLAPQNDILAKFSVSIGRDENVDAYCLQAQLGYVRLSRYFNIFSIVSFAILSKSNRPTNSIAS